MTGYCMKCKAKKEMLREDTITTKNNRSMAIGVCADCGTRICKMICKPTTEDRIIE